jgi:sirohydrochlorin ferrochelatase
VPRHADCSPAALEHDAMLQVLFDQLEDALHRCDGDTAITVLHHLETVAGREFVHRLTVYLIATALARISPPPTNPN